MMRPPEPAILGCSPPPWSFWPHPAVPGRPWPQAPPTRSSEFVGSWDPASHWGGDGGRPLRAPGEPLGRVRRRLLRATAAALALTPVLLALTPAMVALALGKLPAA